MAHRMAFQAGRSVPLAVKVSHEGDGWLIPYEPSETSASDTTDDQMATPPNLEGTSLELLAVDMTPLDRSDNETDDSLWLTARFTDTLGRKIEIEATGLVLGADEQHFGGVATNFYHVEDEQWFVRPLQAWGRFDIRVNDALTDSSLMGVVTLGERIQEENDDQVIPTLTMTILPQRVNAEGKRSSVPVQAAEELGMASWTIHWDDVSYCQAPVMSVRAERGDTLATVAKQMTVDHDALVRANATISGNQRLEAGALLRVPMLICATTAATKKVHPSVSLTWKEIMNGWTTLN